MHVLPVSMPVPYLHTWYPQRLERALNSLELELQIVLNCYVGYVTGIDPIRIFICLLETGFHCMALAGWGLPLYKPGYP